LQLTQFAKINKSNLEIKLLQSEFIFLGLDDVAKLKSIANITDIWIEETDEALKRDLLQLLLRLRGRNLIFPEFFTSFNPISEFHWLKETFFDKEFKLASTFILETTYKNNKFLDEDYKQVLENMKEEDENYYNIYVLNKWGSLTKGIIYKHFKTVDNYDNIKQDNFFYGLDFGFNHPTALIKIYEDEKKFYTEEEIYLSGLTSFDLIKLMNDLNISKTAEIYADNARPEMIKDLRNAGYNIFEAYKGKNSVKEGISFLKSCEIYTLKSNYGLNKELSKYKWKETKDGRVLDEPVKLFDDALDAVRYGIYTRNKTFGTNKPVIAKIKRKFNKKSYYKN